jgi:cyclic pyranopterin phosphate synthase
MTPFDAPLAAPPASPSPSAQRLADPFGRTIDYLRVSVTDRCDLRCIYCMPEQMRFLPKPEVLTIAELDRLCTAFIGLGTTKLRLTGGEPLVRKGFMDLVERLSRHLRSSALRELTLTTNGTQLAAHAADLARLGVRRINVSLDTLDPATFARLTRGGDLGAVLAGLDAAQAAGLKVKLNAVALAKDNRAEIPRLLQFAHNLGMDLTLIETMPMGEIDQDRTDQYVSLAEVKTDLAAIWILNPVAHATGGPARYYRVAETGGLLGFITPLSQHFCATCNRVRVTCTGVLHACLGHEDAVDLRSRLRDHPHDDRPLIDAIRRGVAEKPERHDFRIAAGAAPAVARPMSMTGG